MEVLLAITCAIATLSEAFYIDDSDVKTIIKTKGSHKIWHNLPLTKNSNELDLFKVATDRPLFLQKGVNDIYNWIEDDVVQKAGYSDEDGEDILELPGGCELTTDQYKRLQDFRRDASYVHKCYCQEGGVYCKLKTTGEHLQIGLT